MDILACVFLIAGAFFLFFALYDKLTPLSAHDICTEEKKLTYHTWTKLGDRAQVETVLSDDEIVPHEKYTLLRYMILHRMHTAVRRSKYKNHISFKSPSELFAPFLQEPLFLNLQIGWSIVAVAAMIIGICYGYSQHVSLIITGLMCMSILLISLMLFYFHRALKILRVHNTVSRLLHFYEGQHKHFDPELKHHFSVFTQALKMGEKARMTHLPFAEEVVQAKAMLVLFDTLIKEAPNYTINGKGWWD